VRQTATNTVQYCKVASIPPHASTVRVLHSTVPVSQSPVNTHGLWSDVASKPQLQSSTMYCAVIFQCNRDLPFTVLYVQLLLGWHSNVAIPLGIHDVPGRRYVQYSTVMREVRNWASLSASRSSILYSLKILDKVQYCTVLYCTVSKLFSVVQQHVTNNHLNVYSTVCGHSLCAVECRSVAALTTAQRSLTAPKPYPRQYYFGA